MKKGHILFVCLIMSATSLSSTAYAQDSSNDSGELGDTMMPVGHHVLPPNFIGGPSNKASHKEKEKTDVDNSKDSESKNPDNNDDFRPAPPDTTPVATTQGGVGGNSALHPKGQIDLGTSGASMVDSAYEDDNTNANGNHQGSVLSALPDRSREDEGAELHEALRNLLPPPSFLHEARKRRAEVEKEDASPIDTAQKPMTRTINVTLRPGEAPPVIHLAYGAVTTLTFSDVTGAPWYVGNVVTDSNSYLTTQGAGNNDVKSNIITIAPKTRYSSGRNVAIMLEHAALPVILELDTGMASNTVDYRVDISVMQRGPNAREDFVETGLAPAQDPELQGFVDGIPPKGSKALKSSNPSVEIWKFKGMMYVRTSEKLVSPIWVRKSSSNISGDTVYVLRPTPNVMISTDGELSSVMIGQ